MKTIMKTDMSTKVLLGLVAVGLFANAAVDIVEDAQALHYVAHNKFTEVAIAGSSKWQDKSPIVVHCVNCN